jgi:hypothetical protein
MDRFIFIIIVPLIILCLLLGGISGLAVWLFCLIIAYRVGYGINKKNSIDNYSGKILFNSFVIISFVGFLLVLDNINNYGTQFGYAGDDGRFYDNIIALLENQGSEESGVFERIFSVVVWCIERPMFTHADLLDILPFNWLLGALVCYLSYELLCKIGNKRYPIWIIYFSLILNYNFIDSVVRLYRDGLLYVFYLAAIISIDKKDYIRSQFYILGAGVMRGANAFLLLSLLFIRFLNEKVKSKILVSISIIGVVSVVVYNINIYGPQVFNYASDYFRSSRYSSAFAGYSLNEVYESRQNALSGSLDESTVTAKIYQNEGIISIIGKPAISFFFPLRMVSLVSNKESHSYKAQINSTRNFNFYNLYIDATIFSWVLVFPLFLIGLYNSLLLSDMKFVLAIYYLFTLFMVAHISGQMRHGLAFIVLTPIFVGYGLELYGSVPKCKKQVISIGVLTVIGIILFNTMSI